MRKYFIEDRNNYGFVLAIGVVLFASLTLPLVPVWAACFRIIILALFMFLFIRKESRIFSYQSAFLIAALVVLGFVFLLEVSSFMGSPASYVMMSVKSLYGHPFGIVAATAVYCVDLFLIFMLVYVLWPECDKSRRYILVLCLSFYFLSQGRMFAELSALLFDTGLTGNSLSSLAKQLNGLASWGTWIVGFFAIVFLVDSANKVKVILYACLGAGILQALIVDLQWLFSDFSYVLESENFKEYFYRVRGTYYYHASSCQILMLLFFVSLSLHALGASKRLIIFQLLMVSALYLNATRAISLSMILGSVIFLLMMLLLNRRSKSVVALLVFVLVLFSTEVFVIKPMNYVADVSSPAKGLESIISDSYAFNTIIVNPLKETTEDNASVSTPVDIISANSSRSLLFMSGLPLFAETMFLGQGVGNAEIPLEGTAFGGVERAAFGGVESTYSTHALLPDIYIMGSGLSAIALVVFVFLVMIIAFLKIIKERASPMGWVLASLLSTIIAYLCSSFFLPQERNLIVLFVFILLGLIVSLVGISSLIEANEKTKSPWYYKLFLAVISVGALMWVVATSPSFAFPVVEFCSKHYQGGTVFTNSSRMKYLLESTCKFNNAGDSVAMLKDDISSLSNIDDGWVVWSPVYDHDYPKLRGALNFNYHRGWERMPSLTLPGNWNVVKNLQPAISFVKVGSLKQMFKSEDAGKLLEYVITGEEGAWSRGRLLSPKEKNHLIKGGQYLLEFSPFSKRGIQLSGIELEVAGGDVEGLLVEYELTYMNGSTIRGKDYLKRRGNEEMGLGKSFDLGYISSIKMIMPAAVVEGASLRLVGDFYSQHRVSSSVSAIYNLFDHDHGSYYYVINHSASGGMVIDLGPDATRAMKLYRISGADNIYKGASPRQWRVFGSKNAKFWRLIDSREDVNLSSGLRKFDSFYIGSNEKNRYYKFEFNQDADVGRKLVSELEIYLQ